MRVFEHEPLTALGVTRVTLHNKRYYEAPTGTYESVTTILGRALDDGHLDKWRAKVGHEKAAKISTQAANRGTAIHALCERYLENDDTYLLGAMPSNVLTFKSIQSVLDERVGIIRAIEHMLYSPTLRAAGTTDLVADFDGVSSIVDFKTSLKPKREEWIQSYFFQSTAYAMMIEEIYQIQVPQIAIIIAVDHEPAQVFVKTKDQYEDRVRSIFCDKN